MNKRTMVLLLTLVISIIMINIQYFHNNIKASSDYDMEIHSVDSDNDNLPDYREMEMGTNPYNEDSDADSVIITKP